MMLEYKKKGAVTDYAQRTSTHSQGAVTAPAKWNDFTARKSLQRGVASELGIAKSSSLIAKNGKLIAKRGK